MNARIVLIASIFVGTLVSSSAFATDSIRCGNQLVSVGDNRALVRHKCGEPADVSHSFITERVTNRQFRRIRYPNEVEFEISVEAELWLYNFGSNRFMHRLRFIDGRLDCIETLGYGYE